MASQENLLGVQDRLNAALVEHGLDPIRTGEQYVDIILRLLVVITRQKAMLLYQESAPVDEVPRKYHPLYD